MKILKVKTFTTIFLMLSLFLFSIIVVTNYQTYKREKKYKNETKAILTVYNLVNIDFSILSNIIM